MNACVVEDVDGEDDDMDLESKGSCLSDGSQEAGTNKYQIPQKLTNYSFRQTTIMASEGSTASKIPDEHSQNSVQGTIKQP